VAVQQAPLTPPKQSPVPLTDTDQERRRIEELSKRKQPQLPSERLPIQMTAFDCPSKLRGERAKKVAWIQINNTDSRGRAIDYIEWTVLLYDLEINKQRPVAHLFANGRKRIEPGKDGVVQHIIRNSINTQDKDMAVCITLIEFSDGTKWTGSYSGEEGNCSW
jgi:hypothetical protein